MINDFLWCFTVMLSWFVAADEVDKALKARERIEEHQVECHPELVPSACIDDLVDIKLVRKYFTADAWTAVENVVKAKAKSKIYTCGICMHKLGKQSIGCDGCLKWFDFKMCCAESSTKSCTLVLQGLSFFVCIIIIVCCLTSPVFVLLRLVTDT